MFKLLSYFLLTMLDNNVEQVVYPYFHTAVTCVKIYQIEDISNEPGLQLKAFYWVINILSGKRWINSNFNNFFVHKPDYSIKYNFNRWV